MDQKPTKAKILIVDDDEDIIEYIEGCLAAEGHQTQGCTDPRQAQQQMESFAPDLVVMDYAMPHMNGLELLKDIRKEGINIPTIFMSGVGNTDHVKDALQAGADDYIKKPFTIDEFVARINVRLRIKTLHDALAKANDQLKELSETDDVTGLLNMRSMYRRIDYALKQAQRYKRIVACVMMDIDHFKRCNDEHDHLFGSFVLKELGHIIGRNIRDTDFAARYGGDEFLVVLTETSVEGVMSFCTRINKTAQEHLFSDGKNEMRLTLSIGFATSPLDAIITSKDLVRRADKALYEAKESGRNTVMAYS